MIYFHINEGMTYRDKIRSPVVPCSLPEGFLTRKRILRGLSKQAATSMQKCQITVPFLLQPPPVLLFPYKKKIFRDR